MMKENTPAKKFNIMDSLGKYRIPIIVSIILLVVSVVFTIITPTQVQNLTNLLQDGAQKIAAGTGGMDFKAIAMFGLLIALFHIIAFATGTVSGILLNSAIQRYSKDLRESIIAKINRLPLGYYNERPIGDILSIVTNDVDTLGTSLQNCVSMLIQSGMTLIGVVIAMFISCAPMAIVVLLSLPLIILVLAVTIKFALPLFDRNQKVLGEVNACVEENFSGQLVIKAFNAEEIKGKPFYEKNSVLGKSLFLSQLLGGIIQPMMTFISYLTYAAVLIVGGILIINGQITFGHVTAFLVYVSLFQEPLAQIGQASNTLQLAKASSNRVFEFLAAEEMDDESAKKRFLERDKVQGQVEFQDVCFGYRPNELFVKHFSKVVKPGMKVAVVGPTGAGKSTLVNLLMRFYELNSGDIKVDGASIREMSRAEVRDYFGMILQETWVMHGTLRENLVYNLKDIKEERIYEVLEQTGLAHFVETLPKKLDSGITAGSLSSGQQQLVTIARAMLENAPMMILDEATSNVDTRTELLISEALDKLMSGRTSFVIAHRLSTIRNADLILVMKDGNIVETGTHDSLMAEGGLYSEIYNAQFAKTN